MPEIKLQVGSPHVLRDHLQKAAECYDLGTNTRHTLEDAIAQINGQMKPRIDEPEAFGSVIRARSPEEHGQVAADLWQPSPFHGKHYWQSESGLVDVWSELTDVEVLRVGVGEKPLTAGDLSRMSIEAHATKLKADGSAYAQGVKEAIDWVRTRLFQLAGDALTAERKDAFQKAIQAVEELTP